MPALAIAGPQLALHERLNEERKEVDAQERLDPPASLQVHRGHLEIRLQLLEALLQKRLAFVGPKDLELGKLLIIGDQWEVAILKSVFSDLQGIDLVLDVEPRPHVSTIPGALARPAPVFLAEALSLVLLDVDRDPLGRSKGRKALLHSVADASLLAVASPRGLQSLAQQGQRPESPLEAVVAGDPVKLRLPCAVEPDQPVALDRGFGLDGDRDGVCDVAILVGLLPDFLPGATASNDGCLSRAQGGRTAGGTAAGLGEYSFPHGSGSHEVAVRSGQGGADDVAVLGTDRG